MALFFADLVRETSFGSGVGDLPLAGAEPGHRSFAEAVPPGARFHYCIAGVDHPEEWETGEGEIGSGGMLVRLPLASSTNPATGAGAAQRVDFSAGRKTVTLTVAAAWFAATEEDVTGIEDVVGLEAALEGKAAAVHGHAVTDIDGLQDALGQRQLLDAELTALAGLVSAADKLPYFSGPASAATTDFTDFGRNFVGNADAAAARATLGVGDMAVQNADDVAITGGSISGLDALGVAGIAEPATLRVSGAVAAPSGSALELIYEAADNHGVIFAFNRTAGSYENLELRSLDGVNVRGAGASAGALKIAGTQVLTTRREGWGTPSGTATRAGFATGSVSLAQLAERVKALIDDLRAHGLIGS